MKLESYKAYFLRYSYLYKLHAIDIGVEDVMSIMCKSVEDAKTNYQKLLFPRIMPEELYIDYWVRDSIVSNIAEIGVKNVSPFAYQASADFYLIYPPEFSGKLQKEIWGVPPTKREEVWNKLEVPFKKIERSFIGLINQRNEAIIAKGYKIPLDYYLRLYKISPAEYEYFIKNQDKIISYCYGRLPKASTPQDFFLEFGNSCYMCLLQNFPFKNLEEVKDYIFDKSNLIDEFKDKIDIVLGDSSKAIYKRETDRFEIQIDRSGNIQHQSIDLIHEVSHLINRIQCYKSGFLPEEKGSFFSETEAIRMELEFLKNISQSVYRAIFGDFLKVFHRVLFEINIYQNSDQNLDEVYARTFNICFKGAHQTINRSYILDNNIIRNPFSTLPHAVAQSVVIQNI